MPRPLSFVIVWSLMAVSSGISTGTEPRVLIPAATEGAAAVQQDIAVTQMAEGMIGNFRQVELSIDWVDLSWVDLSHGSICLRSSCPVARLVLTPMKLP